MGSTYREKEEDSFSFKWCNIFWLSSHSSFSETTENIFSPTFNMGQKHSSSEITDSEMPMTNRTDLSSHFTNVMRQKSNKFQLFFYLITFKKMKSSISFTFTARHTRRMNASTAAQRWRTTTCSSNHREPAARNPRRQLPFVVANASFVNRRMSSWKNSGL